MRDRFLQSEVQDEGGEIAETVQARPDLVCEMQAMLLQEQAGPEVAFSSLLEVAHMNRMLRQEHGQVQRTYRSPRQPEIRTPRQHIVRFI
jgi:hypothetical protein